MANNSLYVLSEEYKSLYEQLYNSIDEDGVVDVQIMNALTVAKGTFEEKATSVATVCRMLENDEEQIDNEIKRLTAIKKRIGNEKNRIKQYLSESCQKTGIDSIKGLYANISFRQSEETVIDDESLIPDEFLIAKTTITPDKTKIKASIKAGQVVPGAHIESKKNIQIK